MSKQQHTENGPDPEKEPRPELSEQELECVAGGNGKPKAKYLQYQLKNVQVSSY